MPPDPKVINSFSTAFPQFWAIYPRKKARKDAEKAWRQVHAEGKLAEIFAALEWQVPAMLLREAEFRPYPATWLRGHRWEDEPDETTIVPTARERADFKVWSFALGPSAAGTKLEDWVRRQRAS